MSYEVVGKRVFDLVDRDAPDDVWDDFYITLERLSVDGPYPADQPSMGILPYQDYTKPNSFTVPMERGSIWYQVMRDFPVIKLIDAFWFEDELVL